MTSTCINRKNELTESTVQSYCAIHPNISFCSCYSTAPSFIPPALKGLPQCWNQDCANYGYIPVNSRQSCPIQKYTVCTQGVDTQGNSNISTGNINFQDCSDNSNIGNVTSSTTGLIGDQNIGTQGSGNILTDSINSQSGSSNSKSETVSDSIAKLIDTKSNENQADVYMRYLFIIIVIILLAVSFFYITSDQPIDQSTDYTYQM